MDWGLFASIALTVIFGLAAIILAIKLASRKQPRWAHETKRIIGIGSDAPPELELTFAGKKITAAYRSVLVFYNKGNQAVREEDVKQPIRIALPSGQVLRPLKVINASKTTIEFSVEQENDHVTHLRFLFLGHNDGAIIEIIHTSEQEPEVTGVVVDGEIKKEKGYLESQTKPSMIRLSFFAIVLIGVISTVLVSIYSTLKLNDLFLLIILVAAMFSLNVCASDCISLYKYRRFPSWSRHNPDSIKPDAISIDFALLKQYCTYCQRETKFMNIGFIDSGNPGKKGFICAVCGNPMVSTDKTQSSAD